MTVDTRQLVEITPDMVDHKRPRALRYIKRHGHTKAAFAKLCGVPPAIMSKWLLLQIPLPEIYHAGVDAVLDGHGGAA